MAHEGIPDTAGVKPFEVWEENETAVFIFLAMRTQWRTTDSVVIGFDYSVLFELMNLYDIVDRKDLFESVQIMERAAIPIMNKR